MRGVFLEGMRIAITGRADGSGFSVVGYILSVLFSEFPLWTSLYGWIWYLHAILTGVFVAYLPFSRLLHVIMAPVALAMNAASEHEHK